MDVEIIQIIRVGLPISGITEMFRNHLKVRELTIGK